MRKTVFRFFTIADYEDEEIWLRRQHQSGWKMVKMTPPGFYTFESCYPQDVIYRIDFKNNQESMEYMQMLSDFGWECYTKSVGWLYFRKPAAAARSDGEDELFSENESRVEMANHIVRTRLLPLCIIFLCCVIPNMINSFSGVLGPASDAFAIFFGVMFVIYIYLIVYNSVKLRKIKNKYQS